MKTGQIRQRRRSPTPDQIPDTFDGLPPEVWQVHLLQQKTSWSQQDHARIAELTRHWTREHRRRYERRWNWDRPARWH
jgi:hypothetical protein